MSVDFPRRPLIFVAHPDDETIAFGGLLQRLTAPLIVFATDGAPPGYGIERDFGSLKAYADMRFQEASRVIGLIPDSTFKRLSRPDGSYFSDQHLFEDLPDAAISLHTIAQSHSPDAIISHAYEGAHIDHDTCSFLAMHVAAVLSVRRFEFPIYWLGKGGQVIRQRFRDIDSSLTTSGSKEPARDVIEWQLSEAEVECKMKMLAEYHSQRGTVATFAPGAETERMRLAAMNRSSFFNAQCRSYMFQERRPRFYHTHRHRLRAKALLKKFAEFEFWLQRQGWQR